MERRERAPDPDKSHGDAGFEGAIWLLGVIADAVAALIGGLVVAVAAVDAWRGVVAGSVGLLVGICATTLSIFLPFDRVGPASSDHGPKRLQDIIGCLLILAFFVIPAAVALVTSLAFLWL